MEELLSTSGDSSIQDSLLGMMMPDDSSSIHAQNAQGSSASASNQQQQTSSQQQQQPLPPPPPSPMTNALLVSSPYKLVPPPKETDWDPWGADARKAALTVDLWDAVRDESLHDVFLVASDGDQIPASRFVLAARSPVLKRMLYGSFREAKSSTISMLGYDSGVLQGVVRYCTTNTMPPWSTLTCPSKNSNTNQDLESSLRQLVRLYQAADFLELAPLGDLVNLEIRRLTGLYPGLACVVFDEVDDTSSRIGDYARLMMEVRPYMSLGAGTRVKESESNATSGAKNTPSTNVIATPTKSSKPPSDLVDLDDDCNHSMGGVECMRAERMKEIFKSPNLLCGELFLFQMLRQWYDFKVGFLGENVDDSVEYEKEATTLLEAASDCAKCLDMENIEPQALIQIVQPCPFVHPTFLFDAFAKQALRASQNRIWSLHSRPAKYQAVERVLVEDCGSRQARGMYVRMVSNLKKTSATLYTKREVVSGQPMVYTLSCSVNNGQVECRIFCSPLLTPQAIPTLLDTTNQGVDPLFQPILQIVAMKPPSGTKRNSRTVVVSDGHYCMHATLADGMAIHNSKEIQLYGVVQVLAFRLYESGGGKNSRSSGVVAKIHIQRASIVNSNAGQVFGRPTFFKTVTSLSVVSPNNSSRDASVAADETDDGESANLTQDLSVVEDEGASTGVVDILDGDAATNFARHHQTAVKNLQHVTVLYSCSYPLKKQARDTRIPRSGWIAEDAGLSPPPMCSWFPPVKRSQSLHAANTAVSHVVNGFRSSAPTAHLGKNGSSNNKSGDSSLGLSLSLGSSTTNTTAPKNLGSMLKYDGDIEDIHDGGDEEDENEDLSSTLSGFRYSPTAGGDSISNQNGENASLGPLSLGPPIP